MLRRSFLALLRLLLALGIVAAPFLLVALSS